MSAATRKTACYLILRPHRAAELRVRLTQNAPALQADEVAVQLTLAVPDAIFRRPALKATVEIPGGMVDPPVISAEVVDAIRQEIHKQAGIDLCIAVVNTSVPVPA